MRIVSWNIRHGGGKSVDRILQQLDVWSPDVIGLQEFRGTAPSQKIAKVLRERGLIHQATTVDPTSPTRNGLLLASRLPFVQLPADGLLKDMGRWLHVTLEPTHDLHLMLMHVPNRDEGSKYDFHSEVVEKFQKLNATAALAFGDTNTGVPNVDEETVFFNQREGGWFDHIRGAGWQDVWRARNPDTHEFTWYTHSRKGFRLDQLFASASAEKLVADVRYDWGDRDEPTGKTISDHAAIVIDMNSNG